ncbi:hypothetical protein EV193_103727 [Herbihabitans rhizosphaerae]|uniref:Uncharacterized protein n=1 Tax=Herbihabitans rhizosphaerae TaxID=1872711 RepID=A0A4Q7KXF0_9PSEU|nr:hypothetical protein [Herbihabitans rhizosphaerae]RZS41404.1 hypothetical protein EV193_103727 [Herbihabitans rhizosphaerae]
MLIKIIGALVVVWLAFMLIGWVVKAIGTLVIIGVVVTAGVVAYGAIKGKSNKQIRS